VSGYEHLQDFKVVTKVMGRALLMQYKMLLFVRKPGREVDAALS